MTTDESDRGSDCVFCRIVAGEDPAYRVYEDEQTMAFLDIEAVAEGHTLVVPRAHHTTLTDLDPGRTSALFRTVRRVAAAIEDTLDPDGLNVMHASGAAAGQDVFHVHAHVIPRDEDDLISFAPPRQALTDSEGERVAAKIREGF